MSHCMLPLYRLSYRYAILIAYGSLYSFPSQCDVAFIHFLLSVILCGVAGLLDSVICTFDSPIHTTECIVVAGGDLQGHFAKSRVLAFCVWAEKLVE
jgi:hypothetical protein